MTSLNHDAWQEFREAVRSDDLEAVERILQAHPDLVGAKTVLGSCMHFAASKGRLEIVKKLVKLGADIDLRVDVGGTPLDEAASNGHVAVVEYLLDQGASLALPRPDENPLFSAILDGHVDVAKLLIRKGLSPHVVYRGESGQLKNALSFAVEQGQDDIVRLLQEVGCRLPVEGVDTPVWEPDEDKTEKTPLNQEARSEVLINRLVEIYGPVDQLALQEVVPVLADVHVVINLIRPSDQHKFTTLFTTGMSDVAMQVPAGQEGYQYAELLMHLPSLWRVGPGIEDEAWSWPMRCLREIAYHFHLTQSWLGGPYTIVSPTEPPVPLGSNTKQTCLLLIADFSDWSPIVTPDGRMVRFYTVVPLFTEEREFEKVHGVAALLERLKAAGHTAVVSVNRKSVV